MKGNRFFFTVGVIMLLALFANGLYILYEQIGNGIKQFPIPLNKQSERNRAEQLTGHFESSVSEETPVNLLVLGLDNEETRCDVILLFHFDPVSSRLSILSVARDTRVYANGVFCKINAVYSKGGEKMVAEEISEITGLPVHYYITMDFKGFREVIDALGGVDFNVPFRMSYDDPTQNLHIHLRKGLQHLDGRKAEQLVRYRKGNYKGQGYTEGDIGRIKMQQDFIKSLIEQKASLKYLSRADEIFEIFQNYVKTNIALPDIIQYMGFAGKLDKDEIRSYVLPGESHMINGAWFYIHDPDKTADIIEDYINTDLNSVNNTGIK